MTKALFLTDGIDKDFYDLFVLDFLTDNEMKDLKKLFNISCGEKCGHVATIFKNGGLLASEQVKKASEKRKSAIERG